jgi:hypothetical protein
LVLEKQSFHKNLSFFEKDLEVKMLVLCFVKHKNQSFFQKDLKRSSNRAFKFARMNQYQVLGFKSMNQFQNKKDET